MNVYHCTLTPVKDAFLCSAVTQKACMQALSMTCNVGYFPRGEKLCNRIMSRYCFWRSEILLWQDIALVRTPYALSQWQIFQACWRREILLVGRNMPLYFIRFFMLFVLAVVTATLFIRTHMSSTSVADGALYFGGTIPVLSCYNMPRTSQWPDSFMHVTDIL